ncbi:MAG TPA: saccharopine dehydrogenase NADP-binding domain-containing protein [Candidatus Limnocylindrales bacterium]
MDQGEPAVTGDGRIVLVGGYGAVGQVLAPLLGQWFPGRVVVAGRSLQRARELTGRVPNGLTAQRFDVYRPDEFDSILHNADVVVMCVERANEALARECLSRGIGYVDICATAAVLDSIHRLHEVAVSNAATAILSVGLAPGLTNVLARLCVDRLPTARSVDITVLLGAGGDHGSDSLRWTVEQLGQRIDRAAPPSPARVRTWLPGFGRRRTHAFAFSDQHTLTSTLGIPVTTRICFDSAMLTRILFSLRAAGFFALVRRLGGNNILHAALTRWRAGTDRFVIHAAANGAAEKRIWFAAAGRQECRATAIFTAQVVRRLLRAGMPPGVRHIDQLVEAEAFLAELPAESFTLHSGSAGIR